VPKHSTFLAERIRASLYRYRYDLTLVLTGFCR
jgi:hypothetical protein